MFLQFFMPKKKAATAEQTSTARKPRAKKQTTTAASKKRAATKKTITKKAPHKRVTATRRTKTTGRASRAAAAAPVLVYADDSRSFWTVNGEVLNSLLALRDALERMDNATYKHHVTGEKNDFAAWVDEVLEDPAGAKALASCKTPKSARTAVAKCLKAYAL